ncbi:tyrosine-type recombinase/integrase [Kingella negevensis]|uniref:tyrosine-type recombinase/integrase n=1 Tax=Kingella negevensis TaxID=1522312 RepID=UPI0025519C6C|nr:integrase arm-type DNA-binding domain-containing protein [Kingella negevensis]MDK4684800.1 tyrosine-type recombinase/integrase [Kingella negevensis]MDK4707341.1 tyrosine-type recombinase/integrase [Kingella negevensis]MDK4710181.1 tyrosine-type recombinase/integrase [Kingella negevensis]
MKLTDKQCANAGVPEKGTKQLSDGGGMYLEIRANGCKYWKMKYTSPITKRQTILHLGTYPEMNLKAARTAHMKARFEIENGNDPKDQKQAAKKKAASNRENTFEHIARTWHTDRSKQADKWSEDHAARVLRSLELHIFPYIGSLPIAEIMPMQVLEQLKRIEYAGKNDTAHKVYDVVNQVFSYAVRLRICLFNPTAELRTELAAVKQKSFPHITDPIQIGELLRKIDGYLGLPQTRTLLKISPYLFTRPVEIRTMKWSEIDFQAALWEKSGEDMKNGLDFIVPLPKQAIELLESLKPFTGHYEYVFYNIAKNQPLSEAAASKAMQRLGYSGIMTPHGFRHMASTRLNEMNFNKDWIEAQLAHKDPNTTRATYNKAQYLDHRRQMLQEWADYLDTLRHQP